MRYPMRQTLLLFLLAAMPLSGDVIYLKNGSVLLVEKAWEDGDQVKYQTASGVQSIPQESVKRVQGQKGLAPDPSRNQPVKAAVLRGSSTPLATSAGVKKTSDSVPPTIREKARSTRFKDFRGYEEAQKLQQTSGKPIALYFYVDWCGYCARLERNVLSHPEVAQYLDSVLYVSVNPEHGRAEEALFESFNGRGYPTFLMLAKNQPASEIRTAVPPAAFVQACKSAGAN
jgi:thiol-disulfide isomerase/thioredoxin